MSSLFHFQSYSCKLSPLKAHVDSWGTRNGVTFVLDLEISLKHRSFEDEISEVENYQQGIFFFFKIYIGLYI